MKNPSPAGCVNPGVDDPWKEARSVENTVTLPTYISLNTQWTWHADDFDIKYIGGGTYYHYILTGPSAFYADHLRDAARPRRQAPCKARMALEYQKGGGKKKKKKKGPL